MTPCPHRGAVIERIGKCFCRNPNISRVNGRVPLSQCETCDQQNDPLVPLMPKSVRGRCAHLGRFIRTERCTCTSKDGVPAYECLNEQRPMPRCVRTETERMGLSDRILRDHPSCQMCPLWEE